MSTAVRGMRPLVRTRVGRCVAAAVKLGPLLGCSLLRLGATFRTSRGSGRRTRAKHGVLEQQPRRPLSRLLRGAHGILKILGRLLRRILSSFLPTPAPTLRALCATLRAPAGTAHVLRRHGGSRWGARFQCRHFDTRDEGGSGHCRRAVSADPFRLQIARAAHLRHVVHRA